MAVSSQGRNTRWGERLALPKAVPSLGCYPRALLGWVQLLLGLSIHALSLCTGGTNTGDHQASSPQGTPACSTATGSVSPGLSRGVLVHAGGPGEGTAKSTQLPSWLCPNKDFPVPSSISFHSPGQISKLSACLKDCRAGMRDFCARRGVAGLCMWVFTAPLMSWRASAG